MSNWRDNLSSLPDISKAQTWDETLPSGHIVRRRRALKFVVGDTTKDSDPIAFTDSDGLWTVVYGLEGGPYKSKM